MRDADAVQAFLVADEVLRRKASAGEPHCGWVSIRTDHRMPRNIVATGYAYGNVRVRTIQPGDPPYMLPIDDPTDAGEDPAL